jgi:hypothetical protein
MQHGDKLLKTLFLFIWTIAFMHIAAEQLYLYWTYRWLDIPMHFLGGAWVGLAALWLWYYSGHLRRKEGPATRPLLVALGGGLAFGLVWEVYEFLIWMFGGAGLPLNYVSDSLLDLVMDASGAVFAFGIYMRLVKRSKALQE